MNAFLFCAALLLAGCSSAPTASNTEPPSKQVAITTQPTNQIVPIGRPATFTVTATGTAPLYYEWLKNGAPVAGADSPSYTTPNIALADSGSTYQVIVSNLTSSARSSTATVTAGPRAPAIGDLRYLLWEQVTQPGWLEAGLIGTSGNIVYGMQKSYPDAVGTPLLIGSHAVCYPGVDYDCSWSFDAYYLPSGMPSLNMTYKSGAYSNFTSDLQSIAAPNRIIMSLDLEPANKAYAIAYVETTQSGGFDYRLESVPVPDVASTVAADGANGRIVTTLSIDHATGLVDLISYGWQGDTTTAYETKTTIAGAGDVGDTAITQDVGNAAISLAAGGYVISAVGGNDTDGYVLVGTRVRGDTMPRPLAITVGMTTTPATNPDSAYYTEVFYVDELGGGVNASEQ
ncbi:MAG: immunoglobulin domain-containing protein [Acidobacteriota bacterium]